MTMIHVQQCGACGKGYSWSLPSPRVWTSVVEGRRRHVSECPHCGKVTTLRWVRPGAADEPAGAATGAGARPAAPASPARPAPAARHNEPAPVLGELLSMLQRVTGNEELPTPAAPPLPESTGESEAEISGEALVGLPLDEDEEEPPWSGARPWLKK